MKECRRKKKFANTAWEEERPAPDETQPEKQFIQKEEYRRIWQAIMKLEEPYKDVFILHAYGEVKLKEIAMSYGKTESWARVTYYRAKQQIIKEISQ